VRTEFLPFSPPTLGEEEIREVADALRSGWITTGPRTRLFEEAFRDRVGASDALALNSCTAGLHVALKALGVGPGDEVITTATTFVSTANVVEHLGAKPVIVDVEPDTLNIDPRAVEAAISPRTRVLLPVHFAGHPADMTALDALAAHRGLAVVEDAAHAFPARVAGRVVGSGPNLTAFSFYATKNVTTGEGGMLTGDPDLLMRARTLSLHGMSRDAWLRYAREGSWYYEVHEPGFKYNMSDIQAALGLVQLGRVEIFQERRRQVVARYDEAFQGMDALELPGRRPDVEHAWHLYVLRLRLEMLDVDRDRFIRELTERNIGTSVHFIPLHLHPYYRDRYGIEPDDLPVSYSNYLRSVSVPLHPGLADQDVEDVIEAVQDVVDRFRR
jgi:dTDP-4-amino-4,6-dideoxygalactose transaminase